MAINLSRFKLKTLKQISFLTGCTSGTNKTEIQHRLREHLRDGLISTRNTRVVSVDMGIRNLAYCVVETPSKINSHKSAIDLNVQVWKKLDLMQQLQPAYEDEADLSAPSAALFTPAKVSKLAYNVTKQLLEHKPDVILIEEQRFRSSGGSAIQEWTVRVNMLESMLWACLETQKRERKDDIQSFPVVLSVSPAKVAKFWVAGSSTSLSPPSDMLTVADNNNDEPQGRSKITKKDKIAVLKGWLHDADHKEVSISFSDESQMIKERFTTKPTRRATATAATDKLDDLTDCLLQGAAWLKWQSNSRQMIKMLNVYEEEQDS